MENLDNNRERLDKYNEQLSTGKQFDIPSDDPTGVATSMDLRSEIDQNNQHINNLDKGISWAQTTDSALNQAGGVLQRARELAVQGANGSLSKPDREAIADEILQLRDNLVEIANTTHNDRYIFSGNKTQIKPYNEEKSHIATSREVEDAADSLGYDGQFEINFNGNVTTINVSNGDSLNDIKSTINSSIPEGDAAIEDNQLVINGGNLDSVMEIENVGGPDNVVEKLELENKRYTYQGDQGNITREISSGSNLDINATGEYFENPLEELKRLANNLNNDNGTRISEININNLDEDLDQLLSMRSETGAKQKRMEMTRNRLEEDKVKLEELKSDNEDVDIAKTIMDLKMSENVYRAALSSGSRIIQPSLVDFIK